MGVFTNSFMLLKDLNVVCFTVSEVDGWIKGGATRQLRPMRKEPGYIFYFEQARLMKIDHHFVLKKKYLKWKIVFHLELKMKEMTILYRVRKVVEAVARRDGAQRPGEISFIVDTYKTFDLHVWKKSDNNNKSAVN